MKKRLLVVSLAAAMLASMIAGCGGDTGSAGSTADGSTSSSGESAPEAAGTTVEIELFQQTREVVDSFNAAIEALSRHRSHAERGARCSDRPDDPRRNQ